MSESYTVSGRVEVIAETVHASATFKRRDLVIEVNGDKYPQFLTMQFIQEKCDILNSYKVGMQVEVSFNLNGRKWTSPSNEIKYFNTLQAWRISNVGSQQGAPPAPYQQAPVQTPNFNQGLDEDVPF